MAHRYILPTAALLLAVAHAFPAFAHGGHVAQESGHAHWIALAAVAGAAILLAILFRDALARRRKDKAVARPRKKDGAQV